jgi:ribosomal protein L34E
MVITIILQIHTRKLTLSFHQEVKKKGTPRCEACRDEILRSLSNVVKIQRNKTKQKTDTRLQSGVAVCSLRSA